MRNIFLIITLYIFFTAQAISSVPDTLSVKLYKVKIPISVGLNDTIVFNNLANEIKRDSVSYRSLSEIIEYTARYFLNTPYGYPARHFSADEKLMVSFEKFDCVTYVETVLALANTFKNQKTDFFDFADELKKIRYRQGEIGAFPSRLHYFSDWIYCNEQKKIVDDFSGKIDTILWKKKINFMTLHKQKYPQLCDTSYYNQVKNTEEELSVRKRYYLPKENFDTYKLQIKTGDILVLTVNTGGLDVSHTGFALWMDNDLFFLHASKSKRKVAITKVPFKDYIISNKKVTGILVARPL